MATKIHISCSEPIRNAVKKAVDLREVNLRMTHILFKKDLSKTSQVVKQNANYRVPGLVYVGAFENESIKRTQEGNQSRAGKRDNIFTFHEDDDTTTKTGF